MDKYQIKERIIKLQNKISETEKLIYELENEYADRKNSSLLHDVRSDMLREVIAMNFDVFLSEMAPDFDTDKSNSENFYEEHIALNKRKIKEYNVEIAELQKQLMIMRN